MERPRQEQAPQFSALERLEAWFSWGCLLMLVVHPFSAGFFPPVTAFHSSQHILLPILLPVAIHSLWRRRITWVPALIGCASWVSVVPSWKQAEFLEGNADMRVVTLNLGNMRSDPLAVEDALENLQADLVVLQEVDVHHKYSLARRLSNLYPHQVWYPSGVTGKAVLSRFPVKREELIGLSDGASLLDTSFEVDGREVRVLNVHFRAWVGLIGRMNSGVREVEALAGDAGMAKGATLIVGDLNSVPSSSVLSELEALGFASAYEQVGPGVGYTFPVAGRYRGWPGGPMYRLDHVLHGSALTTLSASIGPSVSSDHLPLIADLQFRD